MATTAPRIANEVNVTQLVDTIELVRKNPALGKFTFRARSEWKGGGKTRTTIRSFYGAGMEDTTRTTDHVLQGDEPAVLLGENTGPNAVEAVLHALASCLAVGIAYNAAARGINIRSLSFDLEGELDLHAFLGLGDATRPGYEGIRVVYKIDSDAPRARIEELCEYVQKTSPVLDIVRNPVPVRIALAD